MNSLFKLSCCLAVLGTSLSGIGMTPIQTNPFSNQAASTKSQEALSIVKVANTWDPTILRSANISADQHEIFLADELFKNAIATADSLFHLVDSRRVDTDKIIECSEKWLTLLNNLNIESRLYQLDKVAVLPCMLPLVWFYPRIKRHFNTYIGFFAFSAKKAVTQLDTSIYKVVSLMAEKEINNFNGDELENMNILHKSLNSKTPMSYIFDCPRMLIYPKEFDEEKVDDNTARFIAILRHYHMDTGASCSWFADSKQKVSYYLELLFKPENQGNIPTQRRVIDKVISWPM